jgi:hypothetical protein
MMGRSWANARRIMDRSWANTRRMMDDLDDWWSRWLHATGTERWYEFFSLFTVLLYTKEVPALLPVYHSSQCAATVWSNRRWFPGTLLVILPSLGSGKRSIDPPACYHSYDPTVDVLQNWPVNFAIFYPLLDGHNSLTRQVHFLLDPVRLFIK